MPSARTTTLVAAALLLALAGCATPATPLGVNRPPLPPPALSGPCWPLPTEQRFDFSFQTRDDQFVRTAEGEKRRLLTLQYNRVDAAEVLTQVDDLLRGADFVDGVAPVGSADDTAGWAWLEQDGYGAVGRRAEDLPGIPPDNLVRGTLLLDLPSSSYRKDLRERCGRPRAAVKDSGSGGAT